MLVRPVPTPSAHIQDVVCAGVAPSACAAWNTIATELVKPTRTAMKPATTADRDRSLNIRRAYPTVRTTLRSCRTTCRGPVGRDLLYLFFLAELRNFANCLTSNPPPEALQTESAQ